MKMIPLKIRNEVLPPYNNKNTLYCLNHIQLPNVLDNYLDFVVTGMKKNCLAILLVKAN